RLLLLTFPNVLDKSANAAFLSSSIGKRSARGWKSYFFGASRLRLAGMPVSVVPVVAVMVGVFMTPSHQPSPATLPGIHSRAIGLSRRFSLVWDNDRDGCHDRASLH